MDINPDVLSILVGINDINRYLHGDRTSPFDFDAWDKKYRELLDRTRQENPNLKIVLASPFVAPTGNMSENKDFGEYDKIVERCSAIVEKIARDYKAVYLPLPTDVQRPLAARSHIAKHLLDLGRRSSDGGGTPTHGRSVDQAGGQGKNPSPLTIRLI